MSKLPPRRPTAEAPTPWLRAMPLPLALGALPLLLLGQQAGLSWPGYLLLVALFLLTATGALLARLGRLRPETATGWGLLTAAGATGVYLMGVNPWVGIIGDNVVYIRDAMLLVQGAPMVDSQYGIGLKGMLAVSLALFGDSVPAMKAVVAISGALLPLCTFLVCRRFVRFDQALVISALSAVFRVVVDYSSEVMADVPYAAFSLLALWVVLRYAEAPGRSWRWLLAAASGLGWAYHVKAPALILLVAAILYLLLHRQAVKAGLLALGTACWVVPWILYLRSVAPGRVGYFSSMSTAIGQGLYMPEGEIGGFWHNLVYYVLVKNPRDYLGLLGGLFSPFDLAWVGVPVLVLIAVGFASGREAPAPRLLGLARGLAIHDWYVLGYLAMLFTLPGAPPRYLIPVAPFLTLYLLQGVEALARRVKRPGLAGWASGVLAALLFLVAFRADADLIAFRRAQNGYPGYWGNYYQAALWIREHTPPGSWVAARKPTLVWFWSRRESDLYPWTRDTEKGWTELESRFDYVLLDNLPVFGETQKYLLPILNAHRDRLEVVHVTPPPENYVLRIRKN